MDVEGIFVTVAKTVLVTAALPCVVVLGFEVGDGDDESAELSWLEVVVVIAGVGLEKSFGDRPTPSDGAATSASKEEVVLEGASGYGGKLGL